MSFADEDYPAVPYPGARPSVSYVHDDATGWELTPDPVASSGWRAEGRDLDDWLAARDAEPLACRVPVLCYGSNVCPSKITWLRDALGLTGPAVLLHARCTDVAAVWASGLRVVDDQRPATLTAMPGNTEEHAVWFATPAQVAVLDRCEGRGERYRLARVDTGEVRLADGSVVDGPLAYVAAAPRRLPLLVDGKAVRCLDVPQSGAAALVGTPASTDGLTVREVPGAPEPADFPARVFVYGTLQPGASDWWRLEPHATGEPRAAALPGTMFDTGLGYPALQLGDGPGVSGWVIDLARPAFTLSTLDEYEGSEYRRVRVALPGGQLCWTYVWIEPIKGLRKLTAPWGSADPSRR
ncbi:MAG: gamma-glutamylcyclotransferase family protein [Actinophytocola sp.]|uniref:gamma-glutamylcyclotransferase family protein n=1 Tax=Actinophytocola sp. TaxID=1872138 RepID=UPI003C732B5F